MDARQCKCADCFFAKIGKAKDKYSHATGGWRFKDALLCHLNPPTPASGRPQIEPDGVCVRFTTADLSQPLAHLNPCAVTAYAAQGAGNETEVV